MSDTIPAYKLFDDTRVFPDGYRAYCLVCGGPAFVPFKKETTGSFYECPIHGAVAIEWRRCVDDAR